MSVNTNLTASTELEAVNLCLAAIGEAPVSNLDVTGVADVANARARLRDVSRDTQGRGWFFNTEEDRQFSRTVEGFILVSPDWLDVNPSRAEGVRAVPRGPRLYDLERATFVWERDLKLDVVVFLPFDQLPQAARHYIAVRAAREFQRSVLGAASLEQFTAEHEARAWTELMRMELRQRRANVYQRGGVSRMLDRSSNILRINYE